MNPDCSYLCMFCKVEGRIIIDQDSTHKVCSLHVHQEIQKSTIKCEHCKSTAISLSYNKNSIDKLQLSSKQNMFCDQLCCLCNNLGTIYINQSQYHQICCFIIHKSIFVTSPIYCIHCFSIIHLSESYILPPTIKNKIFLFAFEIKPKNANLLGEIYYKENLEIKGSEIRNRVNSSSQNYDSLSIQYDKSINAFNGGSINEIQDFDDNSSDFNICSDEEANANEVYSGIKPQIYSENERKNERKNEIEYERENEIENKRENERENERILDLPIKNICHIHKVSFSVTKMYHIYSKNVLPYCNQESICELLFQKPYEYIEEKSIRFKDNMILARGEIDICSDCFINTKKMIEASKKFCKNCSEAQDSKSLKFNCGHKGCNYCYFDGNCCFKCWEKSNIPKDQACFKCLKTKFPVQMFCGHYICKKCRAQKKLKRFNYCCIECCLNKMKVCLKCKKICQWELNPDNKSIHKKCCNTIYCLLCFDEQISIFKFIGCLCALRTIKNNVFNS
ncbi:hypothetical protein SteCoe_29495 [Stentor coeruleus]|uniref:RING-type domain-containing protein n=1 Tax=Stentor coeruleus TaxID=5963 RepID=A0A1R2B637_9CILI|nr:hypothetical protein SteCoe_29495 [Stentor coeruleus]